jgi:hypothetical protein
MIEENVDELDLSWTNEYLRTLHGGITYDKEVMNEINVFLYYSNVQDEIIHKIKKRVPLTINNDYNSSTLLQNDLISLLQQYRNLNSKKYKCDGIMKFYIRSDPTTIIDHIENSDFDFHKKECVQVYNLPCDIDIPLSLFIFHSINSIHILFKELVLVEPTTPSILRKKHGKYTKKRVRIAELPEMRKTRKHL